MNGEQAGMPVEGLWPGPRRMPEPDRAVGELQRVGCAAGFDVNAPAVNTPWAITVSLLAVAEVDMNWKCSMPEALLLLGAVVAARVPDREIAPATSMVPAAISRRRWFAHGCAPPGTNDLGPRAAGTGTLFRSTLGRVSVPVKAGFAAIP